MNSLTHTMDEIETQGNLYRYNNESRALRTSTSTNSAKINKREYLWGNSANPISTNSSVKRKQMLLAANQDQKRIAFRINHPFFIVN